MHIDYCGLCFVVYPEYQIVRLPSQAYWTTAVRVGGARSPWVLASLIYKGVTKRWKTDLNQPQYAYTSPPPLSTNLFAPLQHSRKKKNIRTQKKCL
jgi:hypothetical protein